jgi:replicative DNA helicase
MPLVNARANRKEHDMTQQAEAKIFAVESAQDSQHEVRGLIDATTRAMAATDEAHVREAMDGVRWERRGFLGRLSRYDSVA